MCICEVPQGKLMDAERVVYVAGGMKALDKWRDHAADTARFFDGRGAFGGTVHQSEEA